MSQPNETGQQWKDLCGVSCCVFFGVALSVLPHLLWWVKSGMPVWIADNDNLLYLTIASQAFFNHPTYISDPVLVYNGQTMYPWLQFVPGILTAKLLTLDPTNINLIWRLWAGVSIALGWYLLFRQYITRPMLAAVLAIFMLADIGTHTAHPLLKQFVTFGKLIVGDSGELFDGNPQFHAQWRIISPGLSLAFLLFYLFTLARAQAHNTWPRILGAGLAFGSLFYVYFYFWTAAGLGIVMALLLDSSNRRTYFHVGWIGGVIGIPAIVTGLLLKHKTFPDWYLRNDLFLPIPRASELLLPKMAILLLVVCLFWVWLRRKDLIYLWALGASGLILANHQILTGLQIENFHWSLVWGPSISLLFLLLVVDQIQKCANWPQSINWVIGFFCGLHLVVGVWLRGSEATQTKESAEITTTYQHYKSQRHSFGAARLVPNAVTGGDKGFVDFALILENQRPLYHYVVEYSPSVKDAEWNDRIALNGYLRGLNRSVFRQELYTVFGNHLMRGPWARDPKKLAELLESRVAAYDRVSADPYAALDRFNVRYIGLPASRPVPGYINSSRWRRLESGTYWEIWEYTAVL